MDSGAEKEDKIDIPDDETTFLDDITLEAEAKEKEEDDDMDKSADKMIDRKAVIINIDKTKNAGRENYRQY